MDHEPGATHEALPLDPENDIDAKSATRWVVGGAIVLFISLWLLVMVFIQIQDAELHRKINEAPTHELDRVTAAEQDFLGGENPQSKNIEDVIEKLRRN